MKSTQQFTNNQIRGARLLCGFFYALQKDQLTEFLKSDEVQRFLQETAGGYIAGKVPDGTPEGSGVPGTSERNPLDILHDLFNNPWSGSLGDGTPGSEIGGIGGNPLGTLQDIFNNQWSGGLGKIDHPGGADPAGAYGDANFDGPDVPHFSFSDQRTANGDDEDSDMITLVFRDGRREILLEEYDEHGTPVQFSHVRMRSETDMSGTFERVTPASNGGYDVVQGTNDSQGHSTTTRILHFDRNGVQILDSPGEDGAGANTDRDPLSSIEVVGPQSTQQTLAGMKYPGKDPNELDPNSGDGGIKFTEEDKERLGRTAPALDVLDPNSGIDPLSQLNIDPDQINSKEEEIRPEYDSKTKSGS